MSVAQTSHRAVAVLLSILMAGMLCVVPATSYAETSEELEQRLVLAQSTLADLGMQAMAAGETLYETQYELEQTKQQIDETNASVEERTKELADAKQRLASRIRANYKAGNNAPLAAILDDDGLENISSLLYYANKFAELDAQTIQDVYDARTALQKESVRLADLKEEQEKLLEQQEIQYNALQTAQASQAAYVNSLDEALRERLAEEEERERLAQEAEAGDEEARLRLELLEKQDEERQLEAPNISVPAGTGINIADITGDAVSSMSGETRMTILSAAFSQIGVPYVWGGEQPGVGLDCSGFTQYCYRQAGIQLPHSARAQAAMARASSIENLQPGDLVFWIGSGGGASGDHVAMYIGGGNIIHESPGGVRIIPLYGGYTKFGVII